MILIIAGEDDAHSVHVARYLKEKNVAFHFFDYGLFPQEIDVSFFFKKGDSRVSVSFRSKQIDFKDVSSVLYRRPKQPLISYPKDLEAELYLKQECQAFLESLPLLTSCEWVSNPTAVKISSYKNYQLMVASEIGMIVPNSLISNSPSDAFEFLTHEENEFFAVKAFTKPFTKENSEGKNLVTFTQRLSKTALSERVNGVKPCPIIIQEYIEKLIELRITVVGEKCFACAIHSKNNEQTKIDWRKYNIPATSHLQYELPNEVRDQCLVLVKKLGLKFGCIDMIVTPENQYVFLEINPVGQWLWIEELTKLPITEALVDLLVAVE